MRTADAIISDLKKNDKALQVAHSKAAKLYLELNKVLESIKKTNEKAKAKTQKNASKASTKPRLAKDSNKKVSTVAKSSKKAR